MAPSRAPTRAPSRALTLALALIFGIAALAAGCTSGPAVPEGFALEVPHESQWGIYALDRASGAVKLVYASPARIQGVARLDPTGERFAFAASNGEAPPADWSLTSDPGDATFEICTVAIDGSGFAELTSNAYPDQYPAWSPDGTQIAFLSFRQTDYDLWAMNSDGTDAHLLYDSGAHDGDVDWGPEGLVFTSGYTLWRVDEDGSEATRLTDPPGAGTWGNANLPLGDYDPRLSPDGSKVAFERLVDTDPINGSYDIFVVNADGTGETRLTTTGYAQGLPSWSHSGKELAYVVAAQGSEGRYDLHVMNADGSNEHDVTPAYFPANFLCQSAVFSPDDSIIYFTGQWWEIDVATSGGQG